MASTAQSPPSHPNTRLLSSRRIIDRAFQAALSNSNRDTVPFATILAAEWTTKHLPFTIRRRREQQRRHERAQDKPAKPRHFSASAVYVSPGYLSRGLIVGVACHPYDQQYSAHMTDSENGSHHVIFDSVSKANVSHIVKFFSVKSFIKWANNQQLNLMTANSELIHWKETGFSS